MITITIESDIEGVNGITVKSTQQMYNENLCVDGLQDFFTQKVEAAISEVYMAERNKLRA